MNVSKNSAINLQLTLRQLNCRIYKTLIHLIAESRIITSNIRLPRFTPVRYIHMKVNARMLRHCEAVSSICGSFYKPGNNDVTMCNIGKRHSFRKHVPIQALFKMMLRLYVVITYKSCRGIW